jgi:hypothetical protein
VDRRGLPLPDPQAIKAAGTRQRREQWVDAVKKVSGLMQKMDEGALKLLHAEHHSWRDKSENANIYVRRYLRSKDRADLAKRAHERELLKKPLYRQDEPGTRKYFLRPR